MDMSLVAAIMAAQAGAIQMKVAASLLKSNLDSQKSAVQTLLNSAQQGASSLANVAAGVGGSLNVNA